MNDEVRTPTPRRVADRGFSTPPQTLSGVVFALFWSLLVLWMTIGTIWLPWAFGRSYVGTVTGKVSDPSPKHLNAIFYEFGSGRWQGDARLSSEDFARWNVGDHFEVRALVSDEMPDEHVTNVPLLSTRGGRPWPADDGINPLVPIALIILPVAGWKLLQVLVLEKKRTRRLVEMGWPCEGQVTGRSRDEKHKRNSVSYFFEHQGEQIQGKMDVPFDAVVHTRDKVSVLVDPNNQRNHTLYEFCPWKVI